jgi:ABC-type Mn2+/Zn2+ transport system ATPase subunit
LKAVANPEPAPEGQTSLCNVKDVTFSYNMNVEEPFFIFQTPINNNITTATRMGVMGPNGAGKSTFLKLVTDRLKPVTGDVVRHPTASVSYFAQHHIMDLDLTQTPSEYMQANFPEEKVGQLKSHLGKVGIIGTQVDTRMNNLSHGQRSCILFAKITYVCPDLLIMDEPTNFLDMESVDALIAATLKFKGALLLVSHNRGFLHGCVDSYLSIVPGRFEVFDNLKDCERATYQFIEEMESGGGQKAGANAMTNTLTKVKEEKDDGVFVIGAAKPAAAKPVVKAVVKEEVAAPVTPAAPAGKRVCDENLIGQQCSAVYKADGRMYPATIVKVFPDTNEVTVDYTGYNEKAIVKFTACLFGVQSNNKKKPAAAAAKAAPKAAAAPKAGAPKAGAQKQGQKAR